MKRLHFHQISAALVLVVAVTLCLPPAMAQNDSVSIAYRGSGGNYIGDIIIFDGTNTAGNVTLLRLTGPGLPAAGVPVYDLNGAEGTGNPIEVNADGSWRFVWYTSSIKGVDKMQTARYYITAVDKDNPSETATTSIMMKKPEFSVTATPNPLETGSYLQLVGNAEQGSADITIQVTDANGRVRHIYTTAASGSGYFTYAFHVDMEPGDYSIIVTSPSVKGTYRTTVTVIPPQTATPTMTPGTGSDIPVATPTAAVTGPGTSPGVPAEGAISVSSNPSGATVYIDSVSMGMTPITLGDLAPGVHTIEIKSPGYITYVSQVTVRAGETETLSPNLVKNPASLPLSPLTALVGLLAAGLLFVVLSPRRRND